MYSPLYTVTFIKDLLRQMYYEYGGTAYAWNEDERKSKIIINTVNDTTHQGRAQQLPRILIQRGPTEVHSQFINNNTERVEGGGISAGGTEYFRQDVSGYLNLIIEARNEGTCEEISEFTRRFICWSKPFIEAQFGFQAFAKQLTVSECSMDREDTEKFKISISIPYIIEDRWQMTGDLTRLNHIFYNLVQE